MCAQHDYTNTVDKYYQNYSVPVLVDLYVWLNITFNLHKKKTEEA